MATVEISFLRARTRRSYRRGGPRSPPPRLHQHRRGRLRRRRRGRDRAAAGQPDEPVGRRAGAVDDRDRPVARSRPARRSRRSFRKQPLFVRNLTPGGDRRGQRGRRQLAARSADAGRADQGGQGELADHAGRLHPSRLRAAGRGRGREQGAVRRLFLPVPRLGLRHRRRASARGRRRRTCTCPNIPSTPTPPSRSAEVATT